MSLAKASPSATADTTSPCQRNPRIYVLRPFPPVAPAVPAAPKACVKSTESAVAVSPARFACCRAAARLFMLQIRSEKRNEATRDCSRGDNGWKR